MNDRTFSKFYSLQLIQAKFEGKKTVRISYVTFLVFLQT